MKHGMSHTPEYEAWKSMKNRCRPDYPVKKTNRLYGGRGIRVCEEWKKSFVSFLECVGNRPSPFHSLDRIDVNGDYESGNVRWATKKQQSRNTRCALLIRIGRKVLSLVEWAEVSGICKNTLQARLRRGWVGVHLLATPHSRGPRLVRFKGQRRNVTAWAKCFGINQRTLISRLDSGWPLRLAFKRHGECV